MSVLYGYVARSQYDALILSSNVVVPSYSTICVEGPTLGGRCNPQRNQPKIIIFRNLSKAT